MTKLCLACRGPVLDQERVLVIGLGPETIMEREAPAPLVAVPNSHAWLSATLTAPTTPVLLVHVKCLHQHRGSEMRFQRPTTGVPARPARTKDDWHVDRQ